MTALTGDAKDFVVNPFIRNEDISGNTSAMGERWGRPHQGVDFAAVVGTKIPVLASAPGAYISAKVPEGQSGGYGNMVEISMRDPQSGKMRTTRYAHLQTLDGIPKEGTQVTAGQDIGLRVGRTGGVTGPHLHFELRDTATGKALDPMNKANWGGITTFNFLTFGKTSSSQNTPVGQLGQVGQIGITPASLSSTFTNAMQGTSSGSAFPGAGNLTISGPPLHPLRR